MKTNKQQLIDYLGQFITPQKWNIIQRTIDYRTRYLSVALEDIFQPHNASAVLRTCDCFGIQDVHIIENRNEYTINPDVALGSYKWISMKRYNQKGDNTLNTINHLRKQGYRIVATTPHTNNVELETFNLNKGRAVLFFGTERNGLSNKMLEKADECLKIPMYGFTESFNISVSASIILHHLTHKLHQSNINWRLEKTEREDILLDWLKETIKKPELIIKDYCEKKGIEVEEFL